MSYTNGVITAPVSISDVKQALNTSENDLGRLCSHQNINIWAKYKPVRLNVLSTLDQWDFTNDTWKSDSDWWNGLSSNFGGITPYFVTSLDNLRAAYDGGMNGWAYQKPVGTILSPYRLTDFAGYWHAAPPPVQNFSIINEIVQGTSFTAMAIMSSSSVNPDAITLSDFTFDNQGTISSMYFGVVWYNSSNVAVYRCTSTTGGTASVLADFQQGQPSLGTYTVYPFLCNMVIDIDDTVIPSGAKFYTCPNLSPVTVEVVTPQETVDITIDASFNIGSTTAITVNIYGDPNQDIWYKTYLLHASDPDDISYAVRSNETVVEINPGQRKFWTTSAPSAGSYKVCVLCAKNSNGPFSFPKWALVRQQFT